MKPSDEEIAMPYPDVKIITLIRLFAMLQKDSGGSNTTIAELVTQVVSSVEEQEHLTKVATTIMNRSQEHYILAGFLTNTDMVDSQD
jgi:proline dehydrogenase